MKKSLLFTCLVTCAALLGCGTELTEDSTSAADELVGGRGGDVGRLPPRCPPGLLAVALLPCPPPPPPGAPLPELDGGQPPHFPACFVPPMGPPPPGGPQGGQVDGGAGPALPRPPPLFVCLPPPPCGPPPPQQP